MRSLCSFLIKTFQFNMTKLHLISGHIFLFSLYSSSFIRNIVNWKKIIHVGLYPFLHLTLRIYIYTYTV